MIGASLVWQGVEFILGVIAEKSETGGINNNADRHNNAHNKDDCIKRGGIEAVPWEVFELNPRPKAAGNLIQLEAMA